MEGGEFRPRRTIVAVLFGVRRWIEGIGRPHHGPPGWGETQTTTAIGAWG